MKKRNKKHKHQAPPAMGPKCPGCGKKSQDHRDERGNVWCETCHTYFDPSGDDEPSHNDPVRAAMAREEAEARRKSVARWGR